MFRSTLCLAALALATALPAAARAQATHASDTTRVATGMHANTRHAIHTSRKASRHDSQASLQASAKISMDSARAIATAKVPGATVKSSELERYHGYVVYSFDMETAGKPGAEEVLVSARTGKVVKKYHESAKTEAREGEKTSEMKGEKKGEMKGEKKGEEKAEMKGGMKGMHGSHMKSDTTHTKP